LLNSGDVWAKADVDKAVGPAMATASSAACTIDLMTLLLLQ
jgi:hypothetical protein